jgi:methyl-accepting chemotaxis protein
MFKNMKTWMRFLLGFSAVLALMIAIILVDLFQMRASHDKLRSIVEINNARIINVCNMGDCSRENSISIRDIMIAHNEIGILKANRDSIEVRRKIYDENNKIIHELTPVDDTTAHRLMNETDAYRNSTRLYDDKIIELVLAGKYNDALHVLNDQASKVRIDYINHIEELIQYNIDQNQLRYKQAEKAATDARTSMMLLGLLAVLVSLIIAFVLTIGITRPIRIATTLVTNSDLSMDVSAYMKGKNELALMIQSFRKDISIRLGLEKELIAYKDQLEDKVKQRTADLSNVIMEVRKTVNILVSTSTQILAATTQVAAGTAETATAITETTTTVEEVQQAAKQTAQKAKNVAESAQLVAKVSQNGQKAVEDTVAGMNRIREQMDTIAQTVVRLSEQSQSIGGIIASVTDIADQSNLLAVNAAIEAAKAGEQGKGFAVVAQEIKNLAGQSKQSTLQVRNILNDVQKATSAAVMATEQGTKAVEAGVKQSLQAGEAIRILSESSNEAVQAATQIVASSQQQVVGMDQIGVAMQNINQAGTETAVSMVQSEKSAKNLNDLGQKLKEMVEKFKE